MWGYLGYQEPACWLDQKFCMIICIHWSLGDWQLDPRQATWERIPYSGLRNSGGRSRISEPCFCTNIINWIDGLTIEISIWVWLGWSNWLSHLNTIGRINQQHLIWRKGNQMTHKLMTFLLFKFTIILSWWHLDTSPDFHRTFRSYDRFCESRGRQGSYIQDG